MTQPLPPQPPALSPAPPNRYDIRVIASRQKLLIYCILAHLAVVIGRVILIFNEQAFPPAVSSLFAIASLAVLLTATVFVFMMAIALYNTGVAIVLGILTLVPVPPVGLIVLLVVNGKATTVLRQHGVKVGFMGARLSDIPVAPVPK